MCSLALFPPIASCTASSIVFFSFVTPKPFVVNIIYGGRLCFNIFSTRKHAQWLEDLNFIFLLLGDKMQGWCINLRTSFFIRQFFSLCIFFFFVVVSLFIHNNDVVKKWKHKNVLVVFCVLLTKITLVSFYFEIWVSLPAAICEHAVIL